MKKKVVLEENLDHWNKIEDLDVSLSFTEMSKIYAGRRPASSMNGRC